MSLSAPEPVVGRVTFLYPIKRGLKGQIFERRRPRQHVTFLYPIKRGLKANQEEVGLLNSSLHSFTRLKGD